MPNNLGDSSVDPCPPPLGVISTEMLSVFVGCMHSYVGPASSVLETELLGEKCLTRCVWKKPMLVFRTSFCQSDEEHPVLISCVTASRDIPLALKSTFVGFLIHVIPCTKHSHSTSHLFGLFYPSVIY